MVHPALQAFADTSPHLASLLPIPQELLPNFRMEETRRAKLRTHYMLSLSPVFSHQHLMESTQLAVTLVSSPAHQEHT